MSFEAPPHLLHGLVERRARLVPDAPCVVFGQETTTYGEIDRLAEDIAADLARAGVVRGDRVAIYQVKSARAVASILGILKLGAAYVPIDPSAPAERARFIAEHAGARAVLAEGRPKERAEAVGLMRFRAPQEGRTSPSPRAKAIDGDPAYILYTSGSTGTPKGVVITHAQSLAFVHGATEVFALSPSDAVASHAPFNFDLSIIDLFCTFAAGARMVIVPETFLAFPARIAKLIADARITVWNSVPSALVQLANKGALEKTDVSSLRLIMFAGEPFPPKHLRTLRAKIPSARLLNVYGQTEANSSTYHEVQTIPEDGAPLPAGKPFPNYEVLLLDAGGRRIVEPGVEGELYVRGGAVASGYFRDEARTRAAFVQNPLAPERREIVYRTGDRFRFDAAEDLIFLGRMGGAVKCRGFTVEIAEVEARAASHPSVEDAAVVPLPDESAGCLLVLFVSPAGGRAVEPAELSAHLAAHLPRYMLPEAIAQKDALPRTPNGKIDRTLLAREAPLYVGSVER